MTEYDSSNPKHVAIQRRVARVDEQAKDEFLAHAMGTPSGRQYFYDQFVRYVFANPFTPNPALTAYNCGLHYVGQQILADILRVCPDQNVVMMREANARDAANSSRRERSDQDTNGSDPGPVYVHPAFDDATAVGDSKVSRDFYGHEE